MIKSLIHIVEGYRTVYVSSEYGAEILTCLHTSGYPHDRIQTDPDNGVSFRIGERYVEDLCRRCRTQNIPIRLGEMKGLPAHYQKYKNRWGILLGAILFTAITVLSCSVVWEVNVTGNEKLEDAQIIHMLEEYGFGVGTFIGKIDFDVLQNEFLMTTDEIAWLSVNMVGTVAHVQVRENLGAGQAERDPVGVANVVAKEDGQITEIQVRDGNPAVVINDVVRKGDLLISGVIGVGEDGLRYAHAEGRVLARVNRQIVVEIAKNREVKVYTGEKNGRKSIIFFGKEIKLFGKSSIDNPTYDTILSENSFSLPGSITIPIRIREEVDLPYVMEPCALSDSEAYREAMKQYRTEMDELLSEAEILSASVERYSDENVYRITARFVCITDIAESAPITTS